jgi:hypothetical protein
MNRAHSLICSSSWWRRTVAGGAFRFRAPKPTST